MISVLFRLIVSLLVIYFGVTLYGAYEVIANIWDKKLKEHFLKKIKKKKKIDQVADSVILSQKLEDLWPRNYGLSKQYSIPPIKFKKVVSLVSLPMSIA